MRGARTVSGLIALCLIAAGVASAEAPETSVRPVARSANGASASVVVPKLPLAEPAPEAALRVAVPTIRPRPRPAVTPVAPQPVAAAPAPTAAAPAELQPPRRRGLFNFGRDRAATRTKPAETVAGSVCGDPRIKGVELARITSKVTGCGVVAPVQVTSVSGVRLSTAATLDCDTATALRTWVDKAVQPAFGRTGVAELKVAAHYICRGRNNKKGARISEHGRGKAIDISGFVLKNGKEISVERDWRRGDGRAIKSAYKAACGIFGTTLGPGSDGYHEDHLHLDTAQQRNGPYCR